MIAMKSISETLDVYNIGMVTEAANGQILDNSTQPEILLYLNGTFQVIESGLSHVGILHISPLFKFVVYSYRYEYTMVCEWLNGQKLSQNAKIIE